jgi:pimeloyl-ACP methyl ester carboxylesterase
METTAILLREGMFEIETLEGGDGPPLLYLHGVEQAGWTPFLEGLARRHRVIAPRHPGYGSSKGDEHLLDLQDLIYFYLDYLDARGLRGLPLVGHALGGMFAAELAAVQPERFSHLALIAPFGLWNADYPVLDFFVEPPDVVARATYFDPASPLAVEAAKLPEGDEERIAFMLDRVKSLRMAAKYLWQIPNRGLAKRLHRVSAPTLLIWGERDGVCPPEYAHDFQRLIAGSRIATIAGAGHVPQAEQPERLIDVVEAFLG